MKDKKAEGVILLKAFLKENDLVIKIQDNGNGMNPETLEYVRKKVSTNRMKTDTEGIGLNNIAQRLQLMYGYRYRMQIDSEENTGTNVTIILPAHVI